MSEPQKPDPVKLISSVFANTGENLSLSVKRLSTLFGAVDYVSDVRAFDYTRYYEAEMGSSLVRRFVTFEGLICPGRLPEIKGMTNGIEKDLSVNHGRRVNIDPGYISHAHLILATGKAYTHRPYLRDGIYADLTLIYQHHSFRPLEWTYPDYADPKTIALFNTIRKRYLIQLKQLAVTESSAAAAQVKAREEMQTT
jgi:hypothetical protein